MGIEDIPLFKQHIQGEYNIRDIEKADFIKTKSGTSAYIVAFNQEAVPYSIYIPGEISDTVVHTFYFRPRSTQDKPHTKTVSKGPCFVQKMCTNGS